MDSRSVGLFIVGSNLVYPIKKLLDAARNYMNNSYYKSQDANREIQRLLKYVFDKNFKKMYMKWKGLKILFVCLKTC